MWQLGLSSTGMKCSLSLVKGQCFLVLDGKKEAQIVTRIRALEILEEEAAFRRDKVVHALVKAKDARETEQILAVNFSYLRRITRIGSEIRKLG